VFEERVLWSPVLGPMLVITCAVAVNVLIRIPGLPAREVPRLVMRGVAVTAWMSALYALVFVVMSRLFRQRPHRKMDKNELELRRYCHRLLDESILNPHRRVL
jgi:hypothetical protein